MRHSRPSRWDVPFDPQLTDASVQRLLQIEPFSSMDPDRFPRSTPLSDILRNDTRFVAFRPGDIVVREQEYGSSAFLVLDGTLSVLISLPDDALGRRAPRRSSLLETLRHAYRRRAYPEVRSLENATRASAPGSARDAPVLLQDFSGVIRNGTSRIQAGEIFGEMAALTRAARSATVVAETESSLLEIRWQGLRDLLRFTSDFRAYVLRRYRETGLREQISGTRHLEELTPEAVAAVAAATEFRSYGDFEWTSEFRATCESEPDERLAREPIIAEQGHYPSGLTLVRSGFARLTERLGSGERTLSYLGRGQIYGLEELAYNWREGKSIPHACSLRAVGYVDVLHVPTPVAEEYILPAIDLDRVPRPRNLERGGGWAALSSVVESRANARLGFMSANRFINGTATMVIDLDRCTRCDECVRACAVAHDGNPKFVRHGPIFDRKMVANSCMHCVDPVCMIGCPTGAIQREPSSGTVWINDPTCVGCGTCASSCPYSNIRMVEIRDARGEFICDDISHEPLQRATKCDLCLDHPGGPVCVRACPYDALERVDLQDPTELAAWLRR